MEELQSAVRVGNLHPENPAGSLECLVGIRRREHLAAALPADRAERRLDHQAERMAVLRVESRHRAHLAVARAVGIHHLVRLEARRPEVRVEHHRDLPVETPAESLAARLEESHHLVERLLVARLEESHHPAERPLAARPAGNPAVLHQGGRSVAEKTEAGRL